MSDLVISKDKSKLDLSMIIAYLTKSYWAEDRTVETIEKSIEHSICFGVYLNDEQIGLARVVSDQSVFAYIMDVFILESHQRCGYGKQLVHAILNDDELISVENWFLRTMDAQGLYEQFGFTELEFPERSMAKRTKII